MSEQPKVWSIETRAENIAGSAARLAKFCALKAPAIVIERERQMLLRKLILFPVDREAQEAVEACDISISNDEQAALDKFGYYDDLKRQLGEEP